MFLNIFWKKEIPAHNYIRETKYERIQKFMKETYIWVKSPPPKKGRFGPKFPDPRALPMREDFFPYRGAPFGRPKTTLAPFLRGGTLLYFGRKGGDLAVGITGLSPPLSYEHCVSYFSNRRLSPFFLNTTD